MKNIIAIIPARLESKRFPEKVLVNIGGISMIERVYNAGKSCDFIKDVVVASDSQRVIDHVRDFDGKAVLTRTDHNSGTERMSELLSQFEESDIFVNLQGDQPFVSTHMIRTLVQPYLEGFLPNMTTIACPLRSIDEMNNSNTVKVLLDQKNYAIYFSRAAIPFIKYKLEKLPVYHHLGLYAFTREFLKTYVGLKPTPLERTESLEQLRVIEHGYKIYVGLTDKYVPEINTPEDLLIAEQMNLI